MKYCSKCGKELLDEAVICVGCGCAVEAQRSNQITQITLDTEVKCYYLEKNHRKFMTFVIAGFSLLLLGIISFLLINIWVGALVTFLSLFFAIIPQNLVKKEIKKSNLGTEEKAYTKRIIKKYNYYKLSFIIMVVAGVMLCLEATGIIIMDIFLASLPSQYEPSLNSFMDFLTYLNSPEYALYENTRKLQEGLKATRGY